ncbi:MAG: hypothetical protein QY320_09390 [Gammaproteobacteria bacterium]|nr:MAG: hypothetical protein QY320_09390 [Gammaproteobacteria bacterium]
MGLEGMPAILSPDEPDLTASLPRLLRSPRVAGGDPAGQYPVGRRAALSRESPWHAWNRQDCHGANWCDMLLQDTNVNRFVDISGWLRMQPIR